MKAVVTFLLMMFHLSHCGDPFYCQMSPDHTLCKFSSREHGKQCDKVSKTGISTNQKEKIVEAMNNFRSQVAMGKETRGKPGPQPPAANMRQLIWDNELAEMAQVWANQCDGNHDCIACRQTSRFGTGQAVYRHHNPTAESSWAEAIQHWYDQVFNFNNDFVRSFQFSTSLEAYTQLIWADTFVVGCGFLLQKHVDIFTYEAIYICNFGPRGNLVASPIYSTGAPCSKCPEGTSCSKIFPGLCEGEAVADSIMYSSAPAHSNISSYLLISSLTVLVIIVEIPR